MVNFQSAPTSLLLFGESEELNTKYMQEIFNVGFYNDNFDVSLGNLLTFHAKTNNVRRISYCNQINNNQISNYKLVIAAGSKAILDSLEQFKDSDLIGFYSRDENLALLANYCMTLVCFELINKYNGKESMC